MTSLSALPAPISSRRKKRTPPTAAFSGLTTRFWISLLFLLSLPLQAAQAQSRTGESCGETEPCMVSNGFYNITLPENHTPASEEPVAAIMFFHGWQGQSSAVMRNKSLVRLARRLGVALIAPNGEGKTWSYPGSPRQHRNEFDFIRAVREDAIERFNIAPDRIMATGFSMGGSMVWNLACFSGEDFAGFAPVAGAFWEPLPERCPSPVPNMVHVHGTSDTVVPIAGRPIGLQWKQGDMWESLAVWQKQGQFEASDENLAEDGRLTCQIWTDRAPSDLFEVCLHSGGHSIRTEWVERAWQKLSEAKGWH
ncbi:alpha/beta hydrolase family esterase [Kiloniella sp. b19]|uniref:alpha/beta hydrolase family esterase n=1 Tax=Kiloniella sp. GXU_MW_B19 TaxID=3141326 RepID=UPI0031D9C938